MTSRYIIVEDGMPHVADSLPGDVRRVNYLWIVERGWRNQWAFNNDSRYQLEVPNPPAIGRFSKILAHTIYNPAVEVQTEWNQTGEYLKGDVIELVRSGLETDDDIIQQWFDAPDVLRLLDAADSWDQMILAVECIGGGHEVDDAVRRYSDSVLSCR